MIKSSQLVRPIGAPKELLFRSGFNGTTRLTPAAGPYFHGPREQYQDIVGADPGKEGPNWDQLSQHANLGNLRIYYEAGNASQRSAEILPDPTHPEKKILRFKISEPNVALDWGNGIELKSRVQAELYGNTDLRELYQTVKLRLHPDMKLLEQFPKAFSWLTLFEFWNQPFWNDYPYPFRISLSICKLREACSEGLHFCAEAQKMLDPRTFDRIWATQCPAFTIPYSTWMNIEIYYREGAGEQGRLYLAVTPEGGSRQDIMDVRNYTYHPDNPEPSGLTHYNPMKLYTSAALVEFVREHGGSMQLDWDDLAFWKGRQPPEASEDKSIIYRESKFPSPVIVPAGEV